MDRMINGLNLRLARVDQRHVRLVLVLLSLALFVLSAGAPGEGGGSGG